MNGNIHEGTTYNIHTTYIIHTYGRAEVKSATTLNFPWETSV